MVAAKWRFTVLSTQFHNSISEAKTLKFSMSFYMKIPSLIVYIHSLMLLRFVIIITSKMSLNWYQGNWIMWSFWVFCLLWLNYETGVLIFIFLTTRLICFLRLYDSIIQCLTETNQLNGLQDDENIDNEIQAQITCYKAFRYAQYFTCLIFLVKVSSLKSLQWWVSFCWQKLSWCFWVKI